MVFAACNWVVVVAGDDYVVYSIYHSSIHFLPEKYSNEKPFSIRTKLFYFSFCRHDVREEHFCVLEMRINDMYTIEYCGVAVAMANAMTMV